jgi:hypothetical protein
MREYWRTMTGSKQGVHSFRRHELLIQALRPNPYSPSGSIPSGGRGKACQLQRA